MPGQKHDPADRRNICLWLILSATLLVYLRTLNYGMVNWDDGLARRDLYSGGISLQQFITLIVPHGGVTWQPVRDLVTVLLAMLPDSWGWLPYHSFSIGLYLCTVSLFYAFQRQVLGRTGLDEYSVSLAAIAGTLIFALHPSHAEVVAWTLGQKDVLVGFFFIAAIYFHVRSPHISGRDLALTAVFYFLALGSKPSAVSLPLLLSAYDWFFRRELFLPGKRSRLIAVYTLLFMPAIAVGMYFLSTTARTGSVLFEGGFLGRLMKVSGSISFSTLKLLVPLNLTHRYPAFAFEGPLDTQVWASLAVTLVIVGAAVQSAWRRQPWGFFLVWFILALLPNMNLAPIRIERADRYYYLSSFGFAGLAGWAFARLRLLSGASKRALDMTGGFVAVVLAVLCFMQAGYWKDGSTLWGRVVALYPEMSLGHIALGNSYMMLGQDQQALLAFATLLKKTPPNLEAINGAATVMVRQGRISEALDLLEEGLRLAPGNNRLNESMVRALQAAGKDDMARESLERWVELAPESEKAALLLANDQVREGDHDAAIQTLEERLVVAPEDYLALTGLARLLVHEGKTSRADSLLDRALSLKPVSAEALLIRALLYSLTGKETEAYGIYRALDERVLDAEGLEFMGAHSFREGDFRRAEVYFRRVVELYPALAKGWNNLAVTVENMKRLAEADTLYARAISLDSLYADAFFNRGNVLAKLGRLDSALELYRHADLLTGGNDPTVLDALIRTYLAAGDTLAVKACAVRREILEAKKR